MFIKFLDLENGIIDTNFTLFGKNKSLGKTVPPSGFSLTLFVPLSYFNIAPKLKSTFALMHLDFKSNLVTHFQKVWEAR